MAPFRQANIRLGDDLRNILLSGSGGLASPLLNFLALPVILRLYGPEEYGTWILLMSLVIIPGTIAALRYELAIVLVESDRSAGRVVGLCLLLILGVTLLAGGGVFLQGWWLKWLPPLQGQGRMLIAVPPLIFLVAVIIVGTGLCTRLKLFWLSSLGLVVQVLVINVVQIMAPKWGVAGAWGLVLGSLVGHCAGALVLLVGLLAAGNREFLSGVKTFAYGDLLRRFANFPRYSVPYTCVGTFRVEGVKLLFGAFTGASLVGDYGFAQRLTNLPVTLISGAIRPVIFQKAANSASYEEIAPLLRRLHLGLSVLLVPALVAVGVAAPRVLGLLAGDKWSGAVPFVRILLVPTLVMLHTAWLDRFFDVLGRQKLAFRVQAIFSVSSLLALGAGFFWWGSPLVAVGLQAGVLVLYFGGLPFLIFRLLGFPLGRLWQAPAFTLMLVAGMLAVWLGLNPVIGSVWALITGFLATWGLGGWLWRSGRLGGQ